MFFCAWHLPHVFTSKYSLIYKRDLSVIWLARIINLVLVLSHVLSGIRDLGLKQLRRLRQQQPQPKQQLFTCITLFSTFLWRPLHDFDVKPPNATLYGGRGHATTNFNMDKALKNSTPGKVAFIWRIERFQIDAIKFERTQIHFSVMFSLLSSL